MSKADARATLEVAISNAIEAFEKARTNQMVVGFYITRRARDLSVSALIVSSEPARKRKTRMCAGSIEVTHE